MTPDNLLRVLQDAGLGSRRKLSEAIFSGRVVVNGMVVEDLRYPVIKEKDEVALDGKLISLFTEEHTYIVLNKPEGILSTVSDDRKRRTVIDILPRKYRKLNLHPVGRLDMDSTGLLLLTNDGDLTYRLTHPKFEHEKEYLVQANGILTGREITALEQGLELDDGKTYPARVKEITDTPPYQYSIIIHEGRKRIVRRMFARLGYRIPTLKRIRMGKLKLGNLQEGQVREVEISEII